MREVFLRFARLHGDAADRAVTERRALARTHQKNIAEVRRAEIDLDQCGFHLRRLAVPLAAALGSALFLFYVIYVKAVIRAVSKMGQCGSP